MSKRILLWLSSLGLVPAAQAQLTANSPTTTSLYDPVSITLLPGFSTSTDGFEAVVRMPLSTGGS